MKRAAIWLANGALVVLCCYFAARILTTAVAAQALHTPPEIEATQSAAPLTVARSWDDRKAILDRKLFGAVADAAEAEPEPEPENYEKTRLPLRLIGTVAGDPLFSWAAVEDLDSRKHLVVHLGERLKGRAEVVRIERRRLVLRNGGRLEELSLEEEEGETPQRTATRSARTTRNPAVRRNARAARSPIRELSKNRFSVPRGDVEGVRKNPAELFSQARILPKYEDGEMLGVQLNAIKSGSLFESIGIQNGDIITELNGIEITSQQESAAVLRELTQATEFSVKVVDGNGNERELYYEVR